MDIQRAAATLLDMGFKPTVLNYRTLRDAIEEENTLREGSPKEYLPDYQYSSEWRVREDSLITSNSEGVIITIPFEAITDVLRYCGSPIYINYKDHVNWATYISADICQEFLDKFTAWVNKQKEQGNA